MNAQSVGGYNCVRNMTGPSGRCHGKWERERTRGIVFGKLFIIACIVQMVPENGGKEKGRDHGEREERAAISTDVLKICELSFSRRALEASRYTTRPVRV